jgi:hypothetical protein
LFLGGPWKITESGGGTQCVLEVQPLFLATAPTRVQDFAVQPFSIVYEESGGKRFEAYDCVAIPKFSWSYGERIMLEWTVKGKWLPVTTSTDEVPSYAGVNVQPPIIGVNCNLTLDPLFDNVNALSKVTIETGWAITDVADMRETHGFGLGFIALAASPSVEVAVADYSEDVQADWARAEDNTVYAGGLELQLAYGASAISWILSNAQLLSFPTPGDENGYRSNTLKFIAVPDAVVNSLTWVLPVTAPPAP